MRQLLYFKTVCKHKSISKAANELLLPHQTISQAIQSLENEYNVKLFERMSKGVILTADGEYFLNVCNQILDLDAATKKHFSNGMNSEIGRIGIVSNYIFNEHLLPETFIKFEKQFSHIQLDIHGATESEVLQLISNNEFDVGFFHNIKIDGEYLLPIPEQCVFNPIESSKYCLLTGPNSPLKKYNSISIKEALKYQFVFYEEYLRKSANEITHKLLTYYGTPNIVACNSRKLYIEKLLNGNNVVTLGILGISPRFDNNIHEIPLRENIYAELGYIINRENKNIFLKELINLLEI